MVTGVHLLYVFPKVFSLSTSEVPIAQYFRGEGIDVLVSLAAVSCYLAFILTYRAFRPEIRKRSKFQPRPEELKSLTIFGVIFGFISIAAFLQLTSRNGGLAEYYFGYSFYRMDFSGMNVWLIFASRFVYPAMAALAIAAMAKPTTIRVAALILVCTFPILNIAVLFRRSDVLFVGFILMYSLVAVRGFQFSRTTVLLSTLVVAVSITVFPFIRIENIAFASGATRAPSEDMILEYVVHAFEIQEDDEIVRAAREIEFVQKTGDLEYGAFAWNSLIKQFLPSSLFGADFKQSVLIGSSANTEETFYYLAPFGFAEAVRQFGVFGWVIFAGLGALTALVERKADNPSDRVFFILIIPVMCLAATNDISTVPAKLVTFWVLTRFIGSRRPRLRTRRSYDHAKLV